MKFSAFAPVLTLFLSTAQALKLSKHPSPHNAPEIVSAGQTNARDAPGSWTPPPGEQHQARDVLTRAWQPKGFSYSIYSRPPGGDPLANVNLEADYPIFVLITKEFCYVVPVPENKEDRTVAEAAALVKEPRSKVSTAQKAVVQAANEPVYKKLKAALEKKMRGIVVTRYVKAKGTDGASSPQG